MRDREILLTLAQVRLASGDQLRRLHLPGQDSRTARHALARLEALKLILRLDRRVGGVRGGSAGSLYQLDSAGQRLVLPQHRGVRRPWPISVPFQRHLLSVTELLVSLREAERSGPVRLHTFQAEPACWRPFHGRYGERLRLKPDAFVRLDGPGYFDLFFIEVDLDTESPRVLRRKAETYRAYYATGQEQAAADRVFPRVQFLTSSRRRLETIVEVLGSLPPEAWRLFGAGLLDDATRLLMGTEPGEGALTPPAPGGKP